jgi:DNA-binding protein H-NS
MLYFNRVLLTNYLREEMPTYREYQDQIAQLQLLAEQARQAEIDEAKKRIRDLMAANGLTAADFEQSERAVPNKKKGSVVAKYKDPESGKTWTGRGRAPRWLDGKNKEDFVINN